MADLTLPHGLGLVARPPAWDDLTGVTQVVAADERHLHGVVDIDEEDIRADWNRPSFDPEASARVIVDDAGVAVAYAEVYPERQWVHVHPHWHGRGVGGALLDWAEARAREIGADRAQQTVPDADTAAIELLRSRGYEPRWETWLFQVDVTEAATPRPLPDGVTARHLDRDRDAAEVHDLIERSFSEWPDRDEGMSFEDWRAAFLDRDDVDPGLCWVLEADGGIIGIALSLVFEDEGFIEQLAVDAGWRGRGLGGALLELSFAGYRDAGLRTAGLSTESRTGARGLYQHVGMQVIRSFKRWARPLS